MTSLVSGRYFEKLLHRFRFWTISRKPLAGLFSYCIHTPLGSVDIFFGDYILGPNFLLSILRPLATLFDGG